MNIPLHSETEETDRTSPIHIVVLYSGQQSTQDNSVEKIPNSFTHGFPPVVQLILPQHIFQHASCGPPLASFPAAQEQPTFCQRSNFLSTQQQQQSFGACGAFGPAPTTHHHDPLWGSVAFGRPGMYPSFPSCIVKFSPLGGGWRQNGIRQHMAISTLRRAMASPSLLLTDVTLLVTVCITLTTG